MPLVCGKVRDTAIETRIAMLPRTSTKSRHEKHASAAVRTMARPANCHPLPADDEALLTFSDSHEESLLSARQSRYRTSTYRVPSYQRRGSKLKSRSAVTIGTMIDVDACARNGEEYTKVQIRVRCRRDFPPNRRITGTGAIWNATFTDEDCL